MSDSRKEYLLPRSAWLTPAQAEEMQRLLDGFPLIEIQPKAPKKARPPKRTWQDVPDWLRRFYRGCAMQIPFVLYEGEKYALIRVPGEMYWSGIGTQAYAAVRWVIVQKGAHFHDSNLTEIDVKAGGRIKGEELAAYIRTVKELDAAAPAALPALIAALKAAEPKR